MGIRNEPEAQKPESETDLAVPGGRLEPPADRDPPAPGPGVFQLLPLRGRRLQPTRQFAEPGQNGHRFEEKPSCRDYLLVDPVVLEILGG